MDRPEEVVDFTPDPGLFPFESRWFSSSVGPVHYIDEGSGRTLLLLHGNPDWSFLYRKIVSGLRDQFRCVVPDYPGFGLSVHPDGYGYTPAEHSAVVTELVDHLDLTDMVVMGQDWGGPIGMDIASRNPDRVHGLVMGNTWFWPGDDRLMKVFSKTLGTRPLQWLITNRNIFVTLLMKRSLQVKLSDKEFAHYTDVVPTPESRRGIAVFPKQILDAHPWLSSLEERVANTLSDRPVVLIFGRKDPALASDATISRWRSQFPEATYVELPEAGHYIQEDAPDEIVGAIRTTFA
ncbi:MAG: alpha/beta fold hydrolase [Acidimicrobiia bacterium]|nr:alpha/beta fold hydrolase [Acidimicrobiia bacterium]